MEKYMTDGNIKVGKMWTFNKLAGCSTINGCKGTCGKYCKGCWDKKNYLKSPCYVVNSYQRFPNTVIPRHIKNTTDMRKNPDEVFKEIEGQIKRAKIKRPVRIHSAGEFEKTSEILKWFELAKKYPEVPFYVYTKAYDLIGKVLEHNEIPKNMWINISIWHDNGIATYFKWKHLTNIRAFIYDDGYDYTSLASTLVENKRYCPAYDEKGKMNHNVTCDNCKWCYKADNKVVFCHEH